MDRDDRLIDRDRKARRNRLILGVAAAVVVGIACGAYINAQADDGWVPADRCGIYVDAAGLNEKVTIHVEGTDPDGGGAVVDVGTTIPAGKTTNITIRPACEHPNYYGDCKPYYEGVDGEIGDRWGQAIPEDGCVLCWRGDDQVGFSRSGKCKDGAEAAVVSRKSALCSGNDMTLDAALGAPVDQAWREGDAVLQVWEGDRWGASKLVRHETALADGPDGALAALLDAHPVPAPVADNVYLVEYGIEGKDGGLDQWRAYRVTAEALAQAPALGAAVDQDRGGIACGVHYRGSIADATKHFEGAGFSGIRDMSVIDTYEQGQSLYNCDMMRKHARQYDAHGKCLSFYQGESDWSDSTCSVYRFAYDRYTGPVGDLGRR